MKKITNYFVFILISFLSHDLFSQGISINILSPASGSISGESLNVHVHVTSSFPLFSITASVDGRMVNLGTDDEPQGNISLTGLERGEKQLLVEAEDVFGNTVEATQPFIFDLKPSLSINEPKDYSVAQPVLPVNATCTDDDLNGCVSIRAYICPDYDVDVSLCEFVEADGSSINTEYTFTPSADGAEKYIYFYGLDSANQEIYGTPRKIFVVNNFRVSEVESLGDINIGVGHDEFIGVIRDVSSEQFLYLESEHHLKIMDRNTKEKKTIINDPNISPVYGYITPDGVMFVDDVNDTLYEYKDDNLINLGGINSVYTLKINGNYAIWNNGNKLYLRHISTGINTLVSNSASNNGHDIASNGDVVYWGNDTNIYLYRNGITQKLTNGTGNSYPLSDGENIVYRNGSSILKYTSDEGNSVLGAVNSGNAIAGLNYQVNNGWIAYTDNFSAYLISPAEDVTRINNYSNTANTFDVLGSNGEITFFEGSNNRIWFAGTNENVSVNISSESGKRYFIDGGWFTAIGSSLFVIDTSAYPAASVIPGNIDFGPLDIGLESEEEGLVVYNDGDAGLELNSINVSDPENFIVNLNGGANPVSNIPGVIPAGEYRTLTISFSPVINQSFSSRLTIKTNDPVNPELVVLLSGCRDDDDDSDGDDINDCEDTDDDNDGVLDVDDKFPLDSSEWLDTDRDGLGNNADIDDDNDGVSDIDEINTGRNPYINEYAVIQFIMEPD